MKVKLLNALKTSVVFYMFIAAVLMTILIFIKPVIGVADNSDFGRIMSVTGLDFLYQNRFTNVVLHYKISGRLLSLNGLSNYATTHIIPIKAAIAVNKLFFSNKIFDIRFLGMVYSILHIISLMLIISGARKYNKKLAFLVAGLLIFIFCDIGYLAYFNSFFGEASTFVFLLLTTGVAIYMAGKHKITPKWVLVFFLAAVMFAGSKQANLPSSIFIPFIGFSFLYVNRKPAIVATVIICTTVFIIVSLFLYRSVSEHIRQVNQYHSVFYGILKDSPSPEKDLKKLGLDPELKVLTNTTYYDKSIPVKKDHQFMKKQFYNKISYFHVLKFYLTNPGRFYNKLEISANNSLGIRPSYLGNFTFDETGERLELTERATLWSRIKKIYMPNGIAFVILFFSAYLIFLIRYFVKALKNKDNRYAVVNTSIIFFLWGTAITSFVTPVLAAGEADIAKHLFLYNVSFDLLFANALIRILYRIPSFLISLRSFNNKQQRHMFKYKRYRKYAAPAVLLTITLFSVQKISMLDNPDTVINELEFSIPLKVKEVKIGSYVKFGSFRGRDLLWQVANTEKETLLLVADRIICLKPFDAPDRNKKISERSRFGSNLWEQSTLRLWLNSESTVNGEPGFLSGFTEKEISMLYQTRNKSLLSVGDIGIKEGGNTPYYWTNCVPLLLQNYDDAYYMFVEDRVFLPDVREIKEYVYDNQLNIRRKSIFIDNHRIKYEAERNHYMGYWLRTPYVSSDSMVRYIGDDGYVYHRDASSSNMGVLPLVRVSFDSIRGRGSRKNPFVLEKLSSTY